MSETRVETNVVQMRFDNKRFEKNIKQSTDSLNKLKKELKFESSEKTFDALEKNIKKVDFSPLSKGIEKVQASFTFLDTLSATVYHRLSNRLIDIGKKITESVSTQGIKSGFNEYELKMNSFKTIQASAGKEFTDSRINDYLEELNKYADKTIYSFSDMTNNIGKFTNAGVKLNVAVKAIQGISNEAAISGATAQEASRAMYNFSQALSSGYVKLIDWKSIELANMATEEFKTQLLETAKELNVLTKAQNGMYKTTKGKLLNATHNFNDSLADQWLTTEVLTKTLSKYADETTDIGKKAFEAAQKVNTFSKMIDTLKESVQSGWSRVWENVIGNLKEATTLWTDLSTAIDKSLSTIFDRWNKILGDWKELGYRKRTLEAIKTILSNIGQYLNAVGNAFRSIFPRKTKEDLIGFTVGLERIAKSSKPTSAALNRLKDTFKGIFAAIDILRLAFKAFRQTFGGLFLRILKDAISTIFGVSGSLGQMLVNVRKSVVANRTFYKVFKPIADVLEWVYGGLKRVASALWSFATTVKNAITESGGFQAFKNWFSGMVNAIRNFDIMSIGKGIVSMFKGLGRIIDKTLANTFNFYKPLKEKIIEVKNKIVNSKVVTFVVDIFKGMVSGIQKAFDSMRGIKTDGADAVVDDTKKKFGVLDKIVNFFKKAWEVMVSIAKSIWPVIKNVFNSIRTGIQMLWEGITSMIKKSDLGDAGGFLGGAGIIAFLLSAKKFIDSMSTMFKAGKMLTTLLKILKTATKLIKAKVLKEIATSILMLVGAIFVLCMLPADKVVVAIGVILALFKAMTEIFKTYSNIADKMDPKTVLGMAGQMMGLAAAMSVMTVALAILGHMDAENATKGLILLGFLMKMIESTVKNMININKTAEKGSLMIYIKGVSNIITAIARAMVLLMIPLWAISKMMKTYGHGTVIMASLVINRFMIVIGKIIASIAMSTNKTQKKESSAAKTAIMLIGIIGIIKSVTSSIILIMAALSVMAVLITKKWINGAALAGVLLTLTGVLAAIAGFTLAMVGIAEDTKGRDIAVVLGLLATMTLFFTALSSMFVVLSLIPSKWAQTGAEALLAISGSLMLIVGAIAALTAAGRNKNQLDPKGFAAIMGIVVLALGSLTAMLVTLAKTANQSGFTKAAAALGIMAGALTGIIIAAGVSTKFAKGLKIVTTGIAALGVAAAALGAAVLALVVALNKIGGMSDDTLKKIGNNLNKLVDVFTTVSKKLAILIGAMIANIVTTIFETLARTIGALSEGLFKTLIEALDLLIIKAPALINKALQLLVVVLGAIEMGLAPVVFTAIKVAIKFVEALAQGIRDNSDKILDAISSLIDAVAELISKAIARILGLKEWEGAYKALKPIIKNFGSLLIGMFVIEKLRSNAATATSILSTFVAKVSALKATLAAGQKKQAIWDFLGLTNMNAQLQGATGLAAFKFKDGLSLLTKAGVLGKAAGIGALIGTAIGTPIAKVIDYLGDNAVDGIKDIYSLVNKESAQLTKDIYSMGDAIRNRRKELKSDLKEVNTTYDTQYSKMKRLANDIDQTTGKIKKGKEKEVAELVKQANSELGTNLTIENGIVSAIDEQGKKKKFELDQIKEIIEQEKLRNMLEKQRAKRAETEEDRSKAKEQYDKAKTELEDFEKLTGESGELFQAYKRMRELEDKSLKDLGFKSEEERGDAIQELYKKYADLFSQYGLGGPPKAEKFEKLREAMLGENNATYVHLQSNVNEAKKNLDALNEELDDLDYAENALISGSADQIHKATLLLNGKYKRNLTDAQRKQSLDELDAEIDKMFKSINDYGYSQIKDAIEAAKEYAKESGKDTTKYDKLQNQLDELKGFKPNEETKPTSGATTQAKNKVASVLDPANLGSGFGSEMKKIGSDMAKGQLEGFSSEIESQAAARKIQSYQDALLYQNKAAIKSHSPSKLYRDEIGKNMATGIIAGLEETLNAYDPTVLASGFINKLQSYIFPGLALVASGKGASLSPLTPVNFGMSQNGSENYMGNISNMPIGMNLPYKSDLQLINQSLQRLTDRMVEQTDSIIAEVGSLREDVNLVGDKLSHLQVVIDSRTIVGELAPAMNDELLKYGERINRGV